MGAAGRTAAAGGGGEGGAGRRGKAPAAGRRGRRGGMTTIQAGTLYIYHAQSIPVFGRYCICVSYLMIILLVKTRGENQG